MVDYAIVTFIREEYEAVRRHFCDGERTDSTKVPGETRIVLVPTKHGGSATVAIARTSSQGNLTAQADVQDLIDAHSPRLVLAVGIAGAVPTSDIFLGDVLLVNEIHDLTRGAETLTGREEAAASTYLTNEVKNYVANLMTDDFQEWQDFTASINRPTVGFPLSEWTKDKGWDRDWHCKINRVLSEHASRKSSRLVDGVLASSDHLVKSDVFMRRRQLVDRRILANDMESVGVASACEQRKTPLLIIRGISDIVQLPRQDSWKLYACEVVSRFAKELVVVGAVEAIVGCESDRPTELSNNTQSAITSLDSILARIRKSDGDRRAVQCREAFALFRRLPAQLRRRWAPQLFDTLDKPMKYTGDKQLVLEVAKECIDCCTGEDRDPWMAECEARARICGTSWAYQETGQAWTGRRRSRKECTNQ